ncbi:MAG: hypothetical protein K2N66_05635 [Paramuribaculum sp.]|nr:hypothetical protein [Paramuribaculum sp.]
MPKVKKTLNIIKHDPWLEPYAAAIEGRHKQYLDKEKELLKGGSKSLVEFANAHNYFGLHREADGSWVFREWAPHATGITLTGDFSGWQEQLRYRLEPLGNGVWELHLPADTLQHGQFYKMIVHWQGGQGERIPAYATRVV